MSESFVNPLFGQRVPPPSSVVPAQVEEDTTGHTTGHPDVDAVVTSLDTLDDLPVAEHVAVFEQAHESLRRTLSAAGQQHPAAVRS